MRSNSLFALGAITSVIALGACSPSRQEASREQPADTSASMRSDEKLNDANVLAIMSAASMAEVEAGKLAATKATDPDVRKFGQEIATAHQKINEEAQALSQKLGITASMPEGNKMQEEHAKEMAELQEKTGKDFDENFLENQEEDHRALLEKATDDLLPAAQNEEVRAFLHKHLSGIKGHLNIAQALQEKNKSASLQ